METLFGRLLSYPKTNTYSSETLIMDFKTLIINTINYQNHAEKERINIFAKPDMKILENLKMTRVS